MAISPNSVTYSFSHEFEEIFQVNIGVVWQSRDLQLSCNMLYLLNPLLCFFIVLKLIYLFVYRDDSLTS